MTEKVNDAEESGWTMTRVAIVSLVTALLGTCLGFGASEKLAVSSLKESVIKEGKDTEALEKSLNMEVQIRREQDMAMKDQVSALNAAWDKRMEGISRHVDVLVQQNTELITLIRVQQQVKSNP